MNAIARAVRFADDENLVRVVMRSVNAVALALGVIFVLCSCVPEVVGIEAVPTGKFARDLAQCNAEAHDSAALGTPSVKHCMKAKGYRFLRSY
jgi:hypothetical protein